MFRRQSLAQSATNSETNSDPIWGSLGPTKKLLKEIDVDAVVQNDLRTRAAVDFNPKLDEGVTSTASSIEWAEDSLKRKLKEPKKEDMTVSDAYDPDKAPEYTLPKDLIEDDDTAATLKSAHLSEWLHHNGGSM